MTQYVTNERFEDMMSEACEDIDSVTKTVIFVQAGLKALTQILVSKGVLGPEDAEDFIALGTKFEEELLIAEISRLVGRIEGRGK